MVEYTEDYGDGTIGILKPVAPGANLIYRGDDIFPGKRFFLPDRFLRHRQSAHWQQWGAVK